MSGLDTERLEAATQTAWREAGYPVAPFPSHVFAAIAAEYARLTEADSAASAKPVMSVAMSDADEGPA
jgi:hypothetical protein